MGGKRSGRVNNTLTGWLLLSADVAMRNGFGPTEGRHGLRNNSHDKYWV